MTTQSLQLRPQSGKSAYRDNLFLQALKNVDYGHLTIITPEDERLDFAGHSQGPAAMISFQDWEVFDDLIARGEIGFAEAYMDGRWATSDLPALLTFGLVNNKSLEQFLHGKPFYAAWLKIKSLLRENSVSGSRRNIREHYDLGNAFYRLWLDESMTYSCALFNNDQKLSLEEAQQAKYQRILDRLAAKPGDHILDIGCGWGGFARAAAQHGIKVTGLTLSEQQAEHAKARIKEEGLSSLASIELCDYREAKGIFDHIVSIGMFEHVGEKYWPDYFRYVKRLLKPQGKAMIQSITLDDHLFETLHDYSGFIETYIFPGGMLPSKSRFKDMAIRQGLECREIFAFGKDYAITLEHWRTRFDAHREEIMKLGYNERFIKMWDFYLSSCIASFTSNRTDVMQAELTHST